MENRHFVWKHLWVSREQQVSRTCSSLIGLQMKYSWSSLTYKYYKYTYRGLYSPSNFERISSTREWLWPECVQINDWMKEPDSALVMEAAAQVSRVTEVTRGSCLGCLQSFKQRFAKFSQSRTGPLLGHFPCWKCRLAHLKDTIKTMLNRRLA